MKDVIIREAQRELARRDFWEYTKLMASDFYKEDREFLKDLTRELQDFLYSDEEWLIINAPPRHGKSRTATLFSQWVLGRHNDMSIMTGSYNETLSTTFSKGVRNAIQEEKADENITVYSDIFPNTKIKQGDGAMNLWALEGQHHSYLATSPTGTATGFGAKLMIIDDLIKSAKEAYNATTLDGHWEWFNNTMLSRLEEGGKLIIIMTRWHSQDLAGRAIRHAKEQGKKVRLIKYKAVQEDGTMLCDDILSKKSFESKTSGMNKDIVEANYNQTPIDIKGRLYTKFKTYDKLPVDDKGNLLFESVRNYTDTADEGSDYLCSITYGIYNKEAYVLDVIYTKDPMEITEPLLANTLIKYNVNVVDIESNNGGRGYARNVERIMKESGSNKTMVKWFHQSQNKKARILSNSTWVMEHIYFPNNWRHKFPEYYADMNSYQKEGKNAHDDGPDATTGIAEILNPITQGLQTMSKSLLGL